MPNFLNTFLTTDLVQNDEGCKNRELSIQDSKIFRIMITTFWRVVDKKPKTNHNLVTLISGEVARKSTVTTTSTSINHKHQNSS
jgi:hypothetical protein